MQAAKEEYKNTVFSIGEIQRIEFESDELKLDIPKEGITLKEGWNITAVMTTVVSINFLPWVFNYKFYI